MRGPHNLWRLIRTGATFERTGAIRVILEGFGAPLSVRILARTLASGDMRIGTVHPSLSPSMDIQVASNFERLLFDLYGRDGKKLAADMEAFRKTGALALGPNLLDEARRVFAGARVLYIELGPFLHHRGEVVERHIGRGLGVVEPPVGVLLDHHRPVILVLIF